MIGNLDKDARKKHPKIATSSQVPRLENLRKFKNKRVGLELS